MRLLWATGLGLILLAVASCSSVQPQSIQFTPGPASATGTLVSAELSLLRRGTHILLITGVPQWYIESRTVNLREFEGLTVALSGILEANADPKDLPVLVVQEAKRALGTDNLRRWTLQSAGITVTAPSSWSLQEERSTAYFRLPGDKSPLLSIRSVSGSSLPPGTPFYVQNRPAVRARSNSTGIQEVSILDQRRIILLQFDPTQSAATRTTEELRILGSTFDRIVADITFLRSGQSSVASSPSTSEGSGLAGDVCGGEAKLLCPAGWYCEIDDAASALGRCKKYSL